MRRKEVGRPTENRYAARVKNWPYRLWLLLVVVISLVVGCINPMSARDLVYEHIPTVIGLGLLAWFGRKTPLSNTAYTLLAVFFLLHILGAHYLYSNVPYDDWAAALTGKTINGIFGWERNNFDRLVHYSFGVLMAPVVFEMGWRFAGLRKGFWAALLAVGVVSLFGNVYEVIEWLIAVTMSKENAEEYNGQQGDVFDAQKDLALSFAGSVFSAGLCWWLSRRGNGGAAGRSAGK